MKTERNGKAMAVRIVAVAAFLLMGGNALAQQRLMMRVADVYPVGHPVVESTVKVFMEQLKTKGVPIDFQYYPAEQLGKGKDLLSLTQTGVVDIGLVVPSYVSDKMPLSAVTELPGLFASSCEGTTAMYRMARDGALAKQEFGANNMHMLIMHVFAPFQLISTKPFTSLAQVEGQKLRSAGSGTELIIRKLKAVPIRITAPEINESMSRGTLDGGLMGYPTVLSYDLARLTKTATVGVSFGGTVVTYAMAESKWRTLTPEMQKALTEAGDAATRSGCQAADQAVVGQIEKLKGAGVNMLALSADETRRLQTSLQSVGEEWAEQLDKRGKPGTETLKAFRAAVQAH